MQFDNSNKYLSIIKGSTTDASSEGPALNATTWPTALNYIVTLGENFWEKYINASNCMSTAQQFIRPELEFYRDYLMKKEYTNKKLLLVKFAEHLEPTMMMNFLKEYKQYRPDMLKGAITGDNILLVKYITITDKFTATSLSLSLRASLNCNATLCVGYFVQFLRDLNAESIPLNLWGSLYYYGDYSVYLQLKDMLVVPEDLDHLQNIHNQYGSEETVRRELEKFGYAAQLSAIVSRIPAEEKYADILLEHLDKYKVYSGTNFSTEFMSSILSSSRPREDTEKIISVLQGKNFPFEKNCTIDISDITAESWVAATNKIDILNFSEAFMNRLKVSPRLLLKTNADIVHSILSRVGPKLPNECKTQFYTVLGTTTTKWGYDQGYLQDVDISPESGRLACESGNVVMLAIIMKKQVCLENVRTLAEKLCGCIAHSEVKPFLSVWKEMTENQLLKFMDGPYADYALNTSLLENDLRGPHENLFFVTPGSFGVAV